MDYITIQEVGANLAFLTALEKVVKDRKAEFRAEGERQIRNLNTVAGVNSINLSIGDQEVGKLSLTASKPGIYNAPLFAKWAYKNGMGHRRLVIDLDEDDPALDALAKDLQAQAGEARARIEYEADAEAMSAIEVSRGEVVSKDTGEIVPGAYAKQGYIRVTGCKPSEVSEAMRMEGNSLTVAGLLGGELSGGEADE